MKKSFIKKCFFALIVVVVIFVLTNFALHFPLTMSVFATITASPMGCLLPDILNKNSSTKPIAKIIFIASLLVTIVCVLAQFIKEAEINNTDSSDTNVQIEDSDIIKYSDEIAVTDSSDDSGKLSDTKRFEKSGDISDTDSSDTLDEANETGSYAASGEIGDETNTSHLSPEQIESDYLDDTTVYYPSMDLQRILILSSNIRIEINDKYEYIEKSTQYLNGYISNLLHTAQNCDPSILLHDLELKKHLDKANEINQEILLNRTVEAYQNLMVEYEAAYEIAPCSTISLQLARPYGEIIEIYPRDTLKNCDQIFEYGITGIDTYQKTLAYETIDNTTDGDILYRIGQIYHYLGDAPNLDTSLRTELYQIAASYFDIADDYTTSTYYGYTKYYAGMVYHKLGVISGEDNAVYLLIAIDRYEDALSSGKEFNDTLLADNYKFQEDVYERLAAFVKKYGQSDGLEASETYISQAKLKHDLFSSLRH